VPRLTFNQLAEMVNGEVLQGGDIETSSVVIDSREAKPDSVFFAIKGDRLDGHQFLPQALATARGAVVSQKNGFPPDKGIVKVADTGRFRIVETRAQGHSIKLLVPEGEAIPSGKAHNEMLLGEDVADEDVGNVIDAKGKQLV